MDWFLKQFSRIECFEDIIFGIPIFQSMCSFFHGWFHKGAHGQFRHTDFSGDKFYRECWFDEGGLVG